MRYIVLGGNGFIGNGIVNFLKKKKLKYISYKTIPKTFIKLKNNNDVIINCIGKNTNEKDNTRLINLIKILKFKKKKILWIQLSTPLVYQQETNHKQISEISKEIPYNKYASSKLEFDNFLKKQQNIYFNYLILRVSTVYDENMKSVVFKKLKLLSKSFLKSIIINPKVILNYISLKELVNYIYNLSVNKRSWNKIILISENIKLTKLLGNSKDKSSVLNELLFKHKKILSKILKEKILFLTNEKKIDNSYLRKFINIENKNYSNKKLKEFFKLC